MAQPARDSTDLARQLEGLLEGPQDAVYGIDNDGRATMVTPAVAAMTGHALDDMLGQSMHELLHHSHADGAGYARDDCPIYAAFRDGRVHTAEEVFWRKNGTCFPVAYTSTPLREGGNVVGAVVVFRDLSDRPDAGARRDLAVRLRRVLAALEGELRPELPARPPARPRRPLVGASPAWQRTMDAVHRVARTDSTVLLLGESGTGKELVARAIHELGPRRDHPLVTLNCAAVPATLMESELFGHERGAFTGASCQRIGRFEQAGAGTLLLDEIGELPQDAQAKLLRVLQERELERLGGTRTIPCRARVVAATNRDLGALVAAGRFRADLYYRLNVLPLRLPPLRERAGDLPLLVGHFVERLEARLGRRLPAFSPEAERRLAAHAWPGNVRELENVVERAAVMAAGPWLEVEPEALAAPARPPSWPDLDGPPQPQPTTPQPPAAPARLAPNDVRGRILQALERARWKVTGPEGAATALAMHPNTLRYRMRRLGIRRPAA
jgi:formate hydrogenlyase transcriptional activator